MGDEIAHIGVIDARLGFHPPGRIGGGIIGEKADDIDLVEVAELGLVEFFQLPPKTRWRSCFPGLSGITVGLTNKGNLPSVAR